MNQSSRATRVAAAGVATALVAALAAAAVPTAARAGSVEIITNPPGARCAVVQEGRTQHVIASTPATVKILTFTEGLRVTCTTPGLNAVTFELGEPDRRRRSLNGDDRGTLRSKQRRRFAALRSIDRIQLDFATGRAVASRH